MPAPALEKKEKVLVVCQHFWPESFRVNDLCEYLAGRGCEVDVLCGLPNYPEGKLHQGYSWWRNRRQVYNGVNIRRAWELPRGSNSSLRIFLNYVSFPLASLLHVPRLLTRRYNRIFLYQLSPVMMSIAGILVGRVRKVETTMYVLDLWPENLFSVLDVKNPFLRRLATRVSHWHYRQADRIITVSDKARGELAQITGLPEEKIIFIPQCCEKFYEEDVDDPALAERFAGGFNIVFAGNISPAQDFGTVIEAAKRLKSEGIDDVNWIIVGDGMSRAWLEQAVAGAGLADEFFFEGYKPATDIPKYHTIADALLACLVKSELLDCTIPAKVMSYFAAGRPTLLAMDGEAQRLVNEVGCGLAGGSGDSEALYQNIKKLHGMTADERRRMGERGREYHFAHFERDSNLDRLYDFVFGEGE